MSPGELRFWWVPAGTQPLNDASSIGPPPMCTATSFGPVDTEEAAAEADHHDQEQQDDEHAAEHETGHRAGPLPARRGGGVAVAHGRSFRGEFARSTWRTSSSTMRASGLAESSSTSVRAASRTDSLKTRRFDQLGGLLPGEPAALDHQPDHPGQQRQRHQVEQHLHPDFPPPRTARAHVE